MTKTAVPMLLGTILLLSGLCQQGHCGTTGKITGQVTDAEGNPLPGASVVIEGTRHGTEAEEDGTYFLILVEPGVRTLIASRVGYRSQKKTDVVVSSDYTTNVSFELEEIPISLDELVVEGVPGSGGWGMTAMRAVGPPVDPDKTASKYYVTAEDIEMVPVVKDAASMNYPVHINPITGRSRIRRDDLNWLQEREDIGPDGKPGTADDTGRLVHVQPDDYTDISGHLPGLWARTRRST